MIRKKNVKIAAIICFFLLFIILINNLLFLKLNSNNFPFNSKDYLELHNAQQEELFIEPDNNGEEQLFLKLYETYKIKSKGHKNTIYYKNDAAYIKHFKQEDWIFLMGKFIKIEDNQAPAEAGEGYFSWYSKGTFLCPVVSTLEVEFRRADMNSDSQLKLVFRR